MGPLSGPLSRTLFPSLSAGWEDPHGPWTLGLVTCLTLEWGRPFQSRLLLLSGQVLRTGMPFLSDVSPCFLLPLFNLPIQPQWEILNLSPQNLLL